MDITTILATDLETVLGLDALAADEREQFLDSIGEVVTESAILRYLSNADASDQSTFSTWVQAHVNDEHMLGRLCESYPLFENYLVEEIALFKNDALRVLSPK